MALKCDTPSCTKNLKWRLNTSADRLEYGASHKDFKITTVYDSFKEVVQAYGVTAATSVTIPIINLCGACWLTKASGWDADSGGEAYRTIPAKTADDGVYFQNDISDFDGSSGTPDVDKILSTIVHEMMHYISHGHTGIQAATKRTNLHWDECITDFLARKTYFRVNVTTTYKTSYGLGSEFITKAVDAVVNSPIMPAFTANGLKSTATAENASAFHGTKTLPDAFATAFAAIDTTKKVPTGQRTALEKVLATWFITWYLNGPDFTVAGALNKKLDDVLDSSFKGSDQLFGKLTDTNLQYGTPKDFTTAPPTA